MPKTNSLTESKTVTVARTKEEKKQKENDRKREQKERKARPPTDIPLDPEPEPRSAHVIPGAHIYIPDVPQFAFDAFGSSLNDDEQDLIASDECYIRASDLGTRLSELARPPTAVGRRSSSADSAPLQTPSDLVFEPGFYAMKDY